MTNPRRPGRPSASSPTVLDNDDLLDAALEAFADRGFGSMSARELARKLAVSHNLIPQRIGNKEALWYAAVDHGFGVLATALVETAVVVGEVRDIGRDPESDIARLRALVASFIETNASRPALLRIINQEASAPGPRLDHIFTNYIDPVRRFGEEVLESLAARGETTAASVSLFYFLMTHGAGGPLALPALAERFGAAVDPTDPVAVRRHAQAATDLLFDGLLARG